MKTIEARYYSATNTKGPRFRLFENNKAITPCIAMDYRFNTMKEQAEQEIIIMYPAVTFGLITDETIYSKESTSFTCYNI